MARPFFGNSTSGHFLGKFRESQSSQNEREIYDIKIETLKSCLKTSHNTPVMISCPRDHLLCSRDHLLCFCEHLLCSWDHLLFSRDYPICLRDHLS